MAFFVASCIFVVLLFVGPAAGVGPTPQPQPQPQPLPSEGQLFVQELGLSQFMHFSVNPFSESTQHNCVNGTGVDAPPCLQWIRGTTPRALIVVAGRTLPGPGGAVDIAAAVAETPGWKKAQTVAGVEIWVRP